MNYTSNYKDFTRKSMNYTRKPTNYAINEPCGGEKSHKNDEIKCKNGGNAPKKDQKTPIFNQKTRKKEEIDPIFRQKKLIG